MVLKKQNTITIPTEFNGMARHKEIKSAANDDYAYEYDYPDNVKADNVYFTIDLDTKARIRELENYLMRIPLRDRCQLLLTQGVIFCTNWSKLS